MTTKDIGWSAFPRIEIEVRLTPEQVAAAYWEMGSDEQADFFAELYRIAEHRLCLQTAFLFSEIVERADRGDRDAEAGFRTMFNHAEDYPEAAAEWRAFRAKRDLAHLAARKEES